MYYTLGQAAKATGKSKPTLSRAIKKSIISATKDALGQWQIDPAELHRVYPAVEQGNTDQSNDAERSETPSNTSALQVELEILRHKYATAEERIEEKNTQLAKLEEDRDKWRQQATGLLTDQREKEAQQPPKGFWARMLGR